MWTCISCDSCYHVAFNLLQQKCSLEYNFTLYLELFLVYLLLHPSMRQLDSWNYALLCTIIFRSIAYCWISLDPTTLGKPPYLTTVNNFCLAGMCLHIHCTGSSLFQTRLTRAQQDHFVWTAIVVCAVRIKTESYAMPENASCSWNLGVRNPFGLQAFAVVYDNGIVLDMACNRD